MLTGREQLTQNNNILLRISHYGRRLEDGLLVVMLLAMIIIAVVQILLRNIWGTSFGWGDPLLRIMVLWLGLLGAMIATRNDNHISIDILTRYLSTSVQRVTGLLSNFFTLIVCSLLSYHGGRYVLQDKEDAIIAFYEFPAWWFGLIIPFGFAVMALRYGIRCITILRAQS